MTQVSVEAASGLPVVTVPGTATSLTSAAEPWERSAHCYTGCTQSPRGMAFAYARAQADPGNQGVYYPGSAALRVLSGPAAPLPPPGPG
jgi:hypothetical protein